MMNTETKEKISALADGETSGFSASELNQLLDKVVNDPEAKSYWDELHRAKDILSGDIHRLASNDFSTRVMSALSVEPTVLSPVAAQEDQPMPGEATFMAKWIRPVAGFAVAATVAAVTVFSFDSLQGTGNQSVPNTFAETVQPVFSQQENVQQVSTQPYITPVTLTGEYKPETTQWDEPDANVQQQLNHYLVNHTEYSNMGNMQGMMPYARLAGYDTTESEE
jgi:sigma-E factor negative regulatory protein RseA